MAEAEDLRALLSRQHSRIDALEKQLGVTPAEAEDVDLPAAEYNRVFAATVALLIYNCSSGLVISFTAAGGIEGNLSQFGYLLWPLPWTAIFGLCFGTLDSAEAGRRAIRLLRLCCVAHLIVVPLLHWTSGLRGQALFAIFQFLINIFYLPWLCGSMIELLRRRGSRRAQAEYYTSRSLKLAGFQILLLVAAVGQGINRKETYPRIYATFVFSASMSFAWKYMIAIFDVAAVNRREAAKLRLSCIQATALILVGAFVLSGLCGYVLSSQKEPPGAVVLLVGHVMLATGFSSIVPVGRLVWVARYHHGRDDSPA
ncbi:unnamed protein product, partial [Pelagomonas calceolata]